MTARKSTKRTPAKRYTVSELAVLYAKAHDTNTTDAAKRVRAKLRGHFGDVIKADPSVSKVKSAANDGNRWPSLNSDAVNAAKLSECLS